MILGLSEMEETGLDLIETGLWFRIPVMTLRTLTLHDFRNHTEQTFAFDKDIVVFVGGNGKGKTIVLKQRLLHYPPMHFRNTSRNVWMPAVMGI